MAKRTTNLLILVSAVTAVSFTLNNFAAKPQSVSFTFPFFDQNNHEIIYKAASSVSERAIQLALYSVDTRFFKTALGAFLFTANIAMGQIFAKCCQYQDHIAEEMDGFSAYTAMCRKFTYAELRAATNNFNENEKLGKGGFGCVYRGILPDTGEIVAVKRRSIESERGKKEFISEVSIASGLRHRNLVQLLGLCHQRGEFLLVYEYIPNRSLDRYLFSEDTPSVLYWSRRYNIACELASALLYLHEELNHCMLHRDVTPSHVLLDSNFSTKLGGFRLARLMEHDSDAETTEIAGTVGYLAPELLITGRASPKSDVFSFGAVALQIASGRRVFDIHSEGGPMRLVEWAWDLYGEGRILDCADPRLNAEFHVEQMERLLMVGLWCSHPHPQTRPSIRQVLSVLQFESSLPRGLPTEMPADR